MPTSDHSRSQRLLSAILAGVLGLWVLYRVAATSGPASYAPEDLTLKLDPNTASAEELAALPELGEAAARRIIAYREKRFASGHRVAFSQPDDLDRVKGIGPRTIEEIRPYLRFPSTHPATSRPGP